MDLRLSSGQYFGDAVKKVETAGLRLAENVYQPNLRMPIHSHENPSVSLVLNGSCDETFERKTSHCEPWTLIVHPAGEAHASQYREKGGKLFVVDLSPQWAKRVREHSPVLDRPSTLSGGPLPGLAMQLYREFEIWDSVSPLAVEGLVLEMLAAASRNQSDPVGNGVPHWLKKTRELIRCRLSERLTLGEIAKAVEKHPVHLARSFRKYFGLTIGQFQRRIRIDFAMEKLSGSRESLSEIALEAGFSDQSHFSNTFKRLTGINPAQFRSGSRTS